MKKYGVRFYQPTMVADDSIKNIADILWQLQENKKNGTEIPQIEDDGLKYEIRDLVALNDGSSFKGVLAVIRDDAPHIRAADGRERSIVLDENEGVLEKNFFLFYRESDLLVWQVNGRASHISRLANYFSRVFGRTVAFYDIIKADSVNQLSRGIVKRVEFRVARVRNPEACNSHDWEASAFAMMAGAGGSTFSAEIGIRGRGRGLNDTVKGAVHRLLNRGDIRKVKIKLEGQEELIDLMADCIYDKIQVDMAGLYPVPESVYAALASAKDRQQAALGASLGTGIEILE